jgi:hypothetical protein
LLLRLIVDDNRDAADACASLPLRPSFPAP